MHHFKGLLKGLVAFFLTFSIWGKSLAQMNNATAFPSPNNTFLGAASLNNYNASVGVDLYTGTAQVSVPFPALPAKELSIPISLEYVSGRGVRVQDYAGSAGLGWQLNAGGSISRVVRSFPDERENGYLGNGSLPAGAIGTGGQWGKVVVNNYQNGIFWTANQMNAIYPTSGAPPTADGEPDLFYVKTPFFSFQFSFDENGNAVISNSNGIKIKSSNFYNTINYANSSFEVIDDKGNEYYFGSSSASVENTTSVINGVSITCPTTWYLDKITSYNARDVINLTYAAGPNADLTYHYIGRVTYNGISYLYDTTHPVATTVVVPRYISKISSSLGEIDFAYVYDRIDDPNAARLTGFTYKAYNPQTLSNSTTLETYNFNYVTFASPPIVDPATMRLGLSSISVTGNTAATSSPLVIKSFSYNPLNLPSRKLLEVADYWGYNNSNNPGIIVYYPFPNNSLLPDLTSAQADILNKITDVTGQVTQITYELNDYNNASNVKTPVGGLRVNKITRTLPTGENLSDSYFYVDATGKSTGRVFSTTYTIPYFQWTTVGITVFLSEVPTEMYDLNGIFVGYSSVKVVNANGGYTVTSFSNFSDFGDVLNYTNAANINTVPDVVSSISYAYKRGLQLDQISYNSSNVKLSEVSTPLTSYHSIFATPSKKSWGAKWYNIAYSISGQSGNSTAIATYWTNVENYRLASSTTIEYDQITPANTLSTTTNYSYSSVNQWLINGITTTDSKNQNSSKTMFYPDDLSIPMSGTETAAIAALAAANKLSVTIHESDNRNGVTTQVHNTYTTGTASLNNGNINTYLTSTTNYNTISGNPVATRQKLYNYNTTTSNPSSSQMAQGKFTAVYYDYNSAYPTAMVGNASSTFSQTQGSGGFGSTFTTTVTYPFTVDYTGTVAFTMFGGASNISAAYSMTGASTRNGSVCSSCTSTAPVNLTSVIPGSYNLTITVTLLSGTYPTLHMTGSYPQLQNNNVNEFYYEGFEQSTGSGITIGGAHTGNAYFNGSTGSYIVPFVLPNGRSYTLQYYSFSGGIWTFNEVVYTGSVALSGPIDDVRVFPSDALMTTYTYNPLVGKTSETDPSGKSIIYQYDGLNRLQTVRDQDNNILKQYDYQYQFSSVPPTTVNISCINNAGLTGYTVKFTNTTTLIAYTLSLPTTSGTITVPPGTYTINVTGTQPGGITAIFCTQSANTPTGTSVTISGATVSATGCITLTVNTSA